MEMKVLPLTVDEEVTVLVPLSVENCVVEPPA